MKVLQNWTPRGGGVYSLEIPMPDKPISSKAETAPKPAPKQKTK
jgi:hypothetical protein